MEIHILVQEQGHQNFFCVQPADYLESELTEWWNEPSATTSGSMYKQIVVSVF